MNRPRQRLSVESGNAWMSVPAATGLENGCSDYRLQKKDEYTNRYHDIYLFDNQMQMLLAIEDYDYTLWLDNQPCYRKDVVKKPVY